MILQSSEAGAQGSLLALPDVGTLQRDVVLDENPVLEDRQVPGCVTLPPAHLGA